MGSIETKVWLLETILHLAKLLHNSDRVGFARSLLDSGVLQVISQS